MRSAFLVTFFLGQRVFLTLHYRYYDEVVFGWTLEVLPLHPLQHLALRHDAAVVTLINIMVNFQVE